VRVFVGGPLLKLEHKEQEKTAKTWEKGKESSPREPKSKAKKGDSCGYASRGLKTI